MRRKLLQLIISNNTHPNYVNYNYEHTNDINNIDTNKNCDISNNDTLCNDVNNNNTDSNKFNNNGSDNDDVNNIDTENNIDNIELCYNCKCRQGAHLVQKYGESLPYFIQLIQQSNTNILQRKPKHIDIRTKQHNSTFEYYFCHQRNQHLTLNENYTTHDFFWLSLLLCMLENTVLHVHYGGDYIWRFIPTYCFYLWIYHLESKLPDTFSRISIKNLRTFQMIS